MLDRRNGCFVSHSVKIIMKLARHRLSEGNYEILPIIAGAIITHRDLVSK